MKLKKDKSKAAVDEGVKAYKSWEQEKRRVRGTLRRSAGCENTKGSVVEKALISISDFATVKAELLMDTETDHLSGTVHGVDEIKNIMTLCDEVFKLTKEAKKKADGLSKLFDV